MNIALIVIATLLIAVIFLLWLFITYIKMEKVEKAKKENEEVKAKLEQYEIVNKTYKEELKKNETEYHEAVSDPKHDNGAAAINFLHQLSEESRK